MSERKQKILATIIENYICTGEPVGSKTLAEMLDFRISPATVRNEMSTLFDLGLLEQPHTSAGRVPSHLGYRVYLNQLMQCQPLTDDERDEINAMFNVRDPDPDRLLQDAAVALASYTACATISTTFTPSQVTVRRLEVVPIDRRTVVMLVVASNGVIKNKVSRVDYNLNREIIEFFNKFANDRFAGRTINEVTAAYLGSVAVQLGEYSMVFTPLLVGILDLCREIDEGQYYAVGGANLLAYKEFQAVAHELLTTLYNRKRMTEILPHEVQQVCVSIGKENVISELMDTSLVVATYPIGQESYGAIGVVGPVRLDYKKLIPHLEYFSHMLGKLLTDTLQNGGE